MYITGTMSFTATIGALAAYIQRTDGFYSSNRSLLWVRQGLFDLALIIIAVYTKTCRPCQRKRIAVPKCEEAGLFFAQPFGGLRKIILPRFTMPTVSITPDSKEANVTALTYPNLALSART